MPSRAEFVGSGTHLIPKSVHTLTTPIIPDTVPRATVGQSDIIHRFLFTFDFGVMRSPHHHATYCDFFSSCFTRCSRMRSVGLGTWRRCAKIRATLSTPRLPA